MSLGANADSGIFYLFHLQYYTLVLLTTNTTFNLMPLVGQNLGGWTPILYNCPPTVSNGKSIKQ